MPQNSSGVFGPQVSLVKPEPPAPAPLSPVEQAPAPVAPPNTKEEAPLLSEYVGGQLSTTQKEALDKFSARLRGGASVSLPLICRDIECTFHDVCPLVQAMVPLPSGKPCPVEQSAIDIWKKDFTDNFNIPANHPQHRLLMSLVDELASIEGMQNRLMWQAALDPSILKMETVGFSHTGMPVQSERLNPSLDYILRLKDRKLRILREMVATPRAESEARRRLGQDPGSNAAKVTAQLAKSPAGFVKIQIGPPSSNE